MKLKPVAVAAVLAMTSIVAAPPVAMAEGTQLSHCMRNGLIGAGVGGLIGALGSHHHKLRTAAAGAAVGGVGTWAVCRLLSHNDQSRVEQSYQQSLDGNRPVTQSWQSDAGTRTVDVSRPEYSSANCKTVSATISDPQNGRQQLPPETYCRNSAGQWVPQSS